MLGHEKRAMARVAAALVAAVAVACLPIVAGGCSPAEPTEAQDSLSGIVTDHGVGVAGALVRVQTTAKATRTDAAGRFTLSGLAPDESVALTAFAPGYFIGGGLKHMPGDTDVRIELEPHAEADNPDYAWISAYADAGDEANCQNCHADPDDPNSALPFDEWAKDAHAGSAANVRFLTMYTGADVNGNMSPFGRFGDSRRFSGTEPLVPDPDLPYYGPGFRLDYPYIAGSCSACHAPSGSFGETYGIDPTTASGVAAEGITCDLCHKVWDVRLEPGDGLPNRDLPGILSYEFRRPEEGHQFFAGPFDDVAPGEDTYRSIQHRSEYCAGCHYGVFWDTTVYNSFGEWRDSPYSDPETGRTCQDCHMPGGATTHFVHPDKGGLARDPHAIATHKMLGITDQAFMEDAVRVESRAHRLGAQIVVDVSVTNDNTGHHVPTDSPLRHLILLVGAVDATGRALPQTDGPTLPEWCGVGDPAAGYYAGLPGTAYAKVLQEFRSEIAPTGAYWNPTRVLSDNRIAAFETDTTRYAFEAAGVADATVEVTLLFRRAYRELADLKGWSDDDLVMARETIPIPGSE